jgi:GGDEF domain-containing protein
VELANRLRQEVNRPVELNGRLFILSASIGVKVAPAGSATPHDMLRDADTAMYCAKETHSGSHQVFHQVMRERLEADLDRAEGNLLAPRGNSAATYGSA